MILVELIGPPGVGKSTICKELVHYLQHIDRNRYLTLDEALMIVSKKNIDNIFRYIINILPYNLGLNFCKRLGNRTYMHFKAQNRFLAKYGKALESFLISEEFERMSVVEKTMVISSFMEVGSYHECLNDPLTEKTIVFLEEGLVQKSMMFISPFAPKEADKTNLFSYLENIPLPDLTILVNADLTTCYNRITTRPNRLTERLRGYEKNSIVNFLEISACHLNAVTQWIKQKQSVNLLEVNNNQSAQSVVIDLAKKIRAIF